MSASVGGTPPVELEYLTVARQALATSGPAALDALGWWDTLADLADSEARTAVFAVLRAQGLELASSPALGGLMAQPYLDGTAIAPGTVVAAAWRDSPRRGRVPVLVGHHDGRRILVDRPGHGAAVLEPAEVELRPLPLPGRLALHEVIVDPSGWAPAIDEPQAAAARDRSTRLGRTALAWEILGAAEGALGLALEHAGSREQFGEPIGRFQAVRHLLAWARAECMAVEVTARDAVRLHGAAPERYDAVVKALAGRNGRKTCERALQVLGGIGFTAEHGHHHHHSRVLALDALLGTSAALTSELGAWLRATRRDPGFTRAVLLGGPA